MGDRLADNHGKTSRGEANFAAPGASRPNLKDPRVILSFLEADQVVAAKTQTRFGRRPLSVGARAILWGLRIYVVVMMVIVAIAVIHVVHAAR